MKIRFLAFMVFALAIVGCDPSDDNGSNNITDEQFAENFGASASRDFIGQVVDTDNNPVQGATITIGSSIVQTDVNGIFIIEDADVHEKFAYVTAEKIGFIKGSRSLVPTSGKNNIQIMLIPSTPIATISSGAGSEVTLPSGTKVIFDGAFQDEDGNSYSGDVSVSMFHLQSSDENISALMPGMLYAKGEDNEPKVLQTYGMLNVELRGSAGQKLQIKSGHKAQISMKIVDSQMANAPQSIPLWHFDDAVGYWKQDGTATKQGNFYVGEVSHFSWWNCDQFSATVNLSIFLSSSNGTPISFATVQIITENNMSGIGQTNETGAISGPIPVNQAIIVNVKDLCGEIIYSTQLQVATTDINLPITLDAQVTPMKVMGKLVTCDNSPVNKGYALMFYGERQFFSYLENGDFNFTTPGACTSINKFSFVGVDTENSQYSGMIDYVFTGATTNVGFVPACSSIDEFVTFKVNNLPSVTLVASFSHNWWYQNIYFDPVFITSCNLPYGEATAFQMGIQDGFELGVPTNMGDLSFWYFDGTQMNYAGFGLHTPQITINKFGATGDYVDFTFIAQTGSGVNITGIGHVKR